MFGRRTHFSEIGAKSDSLWVQFEPGSPIWILKSDSAAPLMFQIVLDISRESDLAPISEKWVRWPNVTSDQKMLLANVLAKNLS